MASQLDIYNAALLHLGERPLASLSEVREARKALDNIWDNGFIKRVLASGQWKFAGRTIKLAACVGLTPAFGYVYAYQKPTDLVRVTALSGEETAVIPENEYQDEAGFWFANVTPIYVSYVSSLPTHGGNFGIWPEPVTSYAEYKLASLVAMRVTGSAQVWKDLVSLSEAALTRALSLDAMDGPTKFLPQGSWNQSRQGGSRRDRGRRDRLIG